MDRMFKSVLLLNKLKFHVDDDYVDRLSRQYTVVITVFFAFLVSIKQFFGWPINCWCPAQFTDNHVDYTNAMCWGSNTYYLTMGKGIPPEDLDQQSNEQRINYFQWVPMILIVQGILSFLPCQIWRFFNKQSGVTLTSILDAAQTASNVEIREKATRDIVNQMDRCLISQRGHGANNLIAKLCCGNYLIIAYLSIKVLYIINAIGQLFLLDVLLMSDYHMYGAHIVWRLLRGQDWSQAERFPRTNLCEFELRHQSRLHKYAVQCALPINVFNEKIFFLIWFWFLFLLIASLVSFFQWLFRALYCPGQIQYVQKHIPSFDSSGQRQPSAMAKFTEYYLRRDGMFIIRLIGMNMGEAVAGEVICGLWNNYSKENRMCLKSQEADEQSKV